jgi:hypothetical protein
MKRIPAGLVNIAKRFRSSVDGESFPDDSMSATFGPSVEGSPGSLREVQASLGSYMVHVNLSEHEVKAKAMEYDTGLPTLLFEGLQSDNPDTVALAAQALSDLLSVHAPLQAKLHEDFLALGGHSILVVTMRKWSHDATIQAEICHCVGRMLMLFGGDKGGGIDENLVASFVTMGGLHAIYQAMIAFPDFANVQTQGMLALANLCSDFGAASSGRAAKQFVVHFEGVSLLTQAMKAFPDDELVQENGCWLLNNLCRAGGSQEASVIKSTAFMAVAASANRFPDNEHIEKDAHDLMTTFLSGVDKKARVNTGL